MSFLDKIKDIFNTDRNRGLLDVSAKFRLDRHAFSGTMSKFHAATEIGSNRRVGLKFLDAEKTAHFKARFKGLNKPIEGEIALQIVHPRVVETFEFGKTTSGQEYILMEYIDGPGLNQLIKNRSDQLDGKRIMLLRQMAESIQAVHDAGFIHRDICPRNFICNQDISWLKLIDFGLAVPDEPPYRLPGNRTGTPQYMAPEIVRLRATDHRVDIFSFGITAYRLLTLAHPWGSTDTTGKAALAHDTRAPSEITVHLPDIDERLAWAVHKCMAEKPDHRLNSLKSFLASIRDVEETGAGTLKS